jgi:hypothetical protein
MRVIALAAIILIAGCGPKPATTPSSSSGPAQASFKVGDLDGAKRLIFWSIDAFDHVEPFILHQDDFGVVLYNDGSEDSPVARYIIAFQSTREIVHTGDFAAFKHALSRVPKGSVVGRYDTCSVHRAYGLPSSVVMQFEQSLTDAGLRVEEDARVVCYCPNRG